MKSQAVHACGYVHGLRPLQPLATGKVAPTWPFARGPTSLCGRGGSREVGMKMSTCLVLALRILPSAPLAFKKKKYGGLPPYPLRMGCRPYEPCYFHPKVAATGHERLLRCARNDQWENRSVQGPVVSRFGSG
jgi:hypothetical protein